VILATGAVDRLPAMDGARDHVRRGTIRQCPICDAYEVIGRRIVVLGSGRHAVEEALFLSAYSADVTLAALGEDPGPEPGERAALGRAGVAVLDEPRPRGALRRTARSGSILATAGCCGSTSAIPAWA
jgi:thioredoxin reductase (NADPH)